MTTCTDRAVDLRLTRETIGGATEVAAMAETRAICCHRFDSAGTEKCNPNLARIPGAGSTTIKRDKHDDT